MDERKPTCQDSGGTEAGVARRLTGDGSFTLYSSRFGQSFHSQHGAAREASHVFIEGSGAGAKLRRGEPVRVLEVGFGAGLNFLLAAGLADSYSGVLDYVALERDLLNATTLAALEYQQLAPGPLARLLAFRATLPERPQYGNYRTRTRTWSLELRLGEAQAVTIEEVSFDVVFHDAFSPDANAELWSREFLAKLACALRPGGVLVTYTVKGDVRRLLQALGLQVNKQSGPPGGKREMLRAVKPAQP